MASARGYKLEVKSKALYWSIAAVCTVLGIVLLVCPLFPAHAYVGLGWLFLAVVWIFVPNAASARHKP